MWYKRNVHSLHHIGDNVVQWLCIINWLSYWISNCVSFVNNNVSNFAKVYIKTSKSAKKYNLSWPTFLLVMLLETWCIIYSSEQHANLVFFLFITSLSKRSHFQPLCYRFQLQSMLLYYPTSISMVIFYAFFLFCYI